MFDGAPPVGPLMQKELELIGLPAVASGFVGADVELDILDQVGDPGAPAGSFQKLSHFWFFAERPPAGAQAVAFVISVSFGQIPRAGAPFGAQSYPPHPTL